MMQLTNYIDGQQVAPVHGAYIDLYDPSRGSVYGQVPNSDTADLEMAIAAAQRAFPHWATRSADERADILERVAQGIEDRLDELARAESLDNGKPLQLARSIDIPRAVSNFRFFARAISQFHTSAHDTPGAINYTLRQPLGVVATISPWNLPLYLLSWKIAPALAAGNCVIAKPSEVTPLTASMLGEICTSAGLPRGVLGILHGSGTEIGKSLVAHPAVKAVSFTGSTRVGREIAATTATTFRKVSLEMGGKNPNLIFADCDKEQALATTLRSSFANQGQICLCGSRILVEADMYESFRDELVDRVRQLRVGPPLDSTSDQGAVVSQAQYDKVLGYLQRARQEGGHILCGGHALHPPGYENGWYIEPTIIEGLGPDSCLNREEIFGPVVTIAPFRDEAEALALANDCDYGLSATIWTNNLTRAHRLAGDIHAGIVWINCWLKRDLRTPFGGWKQSGVGREGGWEALRFFTETKNVCIQF